MNYLYRLRRTMSVVVLSFFLWSFGGVFDIAYAIKNDNHSSGNNQNQRPASKDERPQKQRPEEDFEKDIEDLYKTLTDKDSDEDTKKSRIRGEKGKLDSLDTELKKKFNETEKFLKDKGLPNEILDRHYKFVKHYEDNLKELKTNLDNIEKARTKREADKEIEKAKAHLEKVKPPKKHKPLDPNKLPHRTAEPVFIEPRTNPEEFTEGKKARAKRNMQESVLVAANGPLTGLLSSDGTAKDQGAMLIALANPPSAADVAETIEVQFTPEIRAKAQELQYNPVKIYNWVRNNIEYVPTYGSIQGANHCLQTKLCNDFDTASLLIALLRASGIHARYAYGTIEIPIEKVKNWLGGFTDSIAAINLLASAGVPTKGMIDGGQVKYVQMEHMWVEAWVNYIPSRGARHKNGQGDTWIRLDASFKQYNYTQGIDIKSAVPFDAQTFIDQIKNTATINETQGYVTNVNSLLVQQTMQNYETQVQNYISQNYPNATVGDVLGKKEIIKQEFSYLMGTLPYRTIVKGVTYTSIPDNLRHKLSFNVTKDIYDDQLGTPINITKSLPELAGKKITLSYSPATQRDEDVINSYLPQLPTDGSSIDPLAFPLSLPAYLINLKPELRIDGFVVATGTEVGFGSEESLAMTFSAPNKPLEMASHRINAGAYSGIALDLARVSQDEMDVIATRNQNTLTRLNANDITLTKDDIMGSILYGTALSYYAELGSTEALQARMLGITSIRLPSEALFSAELSTEYLFGIPRVVSYGGLVMDVVHCVSVAKSLNGDDKRKIQFMSISGILGSGLEHSIPQQFFSSATALAEGVSAIKALRIANGLGIPVYSIDQSNVSNILPLLQLSGDVKVDIQNAVNAGKTVTVSKSNIIVRSWNGSGYIIFDPQTGNGAYMISGGFAGGYVEQEKDDGKTFWSVLSSTFSSLRMRNLVLKEIAQDRMFNAVAKKLGMFGIIIKTIIDVSKIFNDPSLSVAQSAASYTVIASCALLSALAVILPLGPIASLLGPMGTILYSFIYITAILFITNFIEELALETIRRSGA